MNSPHIVSGQALLGEELRGPIGRYRDRSGTDHHNRGKSPGTSTLDLPGIL